MESLPFTGVGLPKAPVQRPLGRLALSGCRSELETSVAQSLLIWLVPFGIHSGSKRREISDAHRMLSERTWCPTAVRPKQLPLHDSVHAAGGSSAPHTGAALPGDGNCPHCVSIPVIFSKGPCSMGTGVLYT